MGKQGRGGKPNRPKLGRITRNRKDGKDIRFVDWKGNEAVNKYAPVAVMFGSAGEGGRGPLISVLFEKGFEANPEEEYYNLYFEKGVTFDFDADEMVAAAGKKRARVEDEETEEANDEEDPFK